MVNNPKAFSLVEIICVLGLIALALGLSVHFSASPPQQQRWPELFENAFVRTRHEALARQVPTALAIPFDNLNRMAIVAFPQNSPDKPWLLIDSLTLPANVAFVPSLSSKGGSAQTGELTLKQDPTSSKLYYLFIFTNSTTPEYPNAQITLTSPSRTIRYRISDQGAALGDNI